MSELKTHGYKPDPESGAGNCIHCAHPELDQRHPHTYTEGIRGYKHHVPIPSNTCVCGLPESAAIHA